MGPVVLGCKSSFSIRFLQHQMRNIENILKYPYLIGQNNYTQFIIECVIMATFEFRIIALHQ